MKENKKSHITIIRRPNINISPEDIVGGITSEQIEYKKGLFRSIAAAKAAKVLTITKKRKSHYNNIKSDTSLKSMITGPKFRGSFAKSFDDLDLKPVATSVLKKRKNSSIEYIQLKERSVVINEIIDELKKTSGKKIKMVQSLDEAFDLNAKSAGQTFHISTDENALISVKAAKMLIDFQRNYYLKNIKTALAKKANNANEYAQEAYVTIKKIKENFSLDNKKPTLEAIANSLINQGVELPRGGQEWTATAVRRIVNRFEKPEK